MIHRGHLISVVNSMVEGERASEGEIMGAGEWCETHSLASASASALALASNDTSDEVLRIGASMASKRALLGVRSSWGFWCGLLLFLFLCG